MSTLQLGANPDAARAKNAAIVIENVARVTHVDRETRIVVRIADMRDLEPLGERLKLAVAV